MKIMLKGIKEIELVQIVKSGPNSELLKMKFEILQRTFEINPNHKIISSLNSLKKSNPAQHVIK